MPRAAPADRPDRLVWRLAAVPDLGAIIGYFAVAGARDPHFELWGIFIKMTQVVLLAALGYLIMVNRRPQRSERG